MEAPEDECDMRDSIPMKANSLKSWINAEFHKGNVDSTMVNLMHGLIDFSVECFNRSKE